MEMNGYFVKLLAEFRCDTVTLFPLAVNVGFRELEILLHN